MSLSALTSPRHSRPGTVSDKTIVIGSADSEMIEDIMTGAKETYVSTPALSVLSFSLHGFLVGLHVLLIFTRMWGWEHSTVFALKYQTWVSLVITTTVTTLGTIYYATLVFLTQKLSARKNLVQWQFLTVTHDIAAAWTGIGSAISCLWQQQTTRSSFAGVFCVLAYLASILTLHVTTPALFAVEIFNSTTRVNVSTVGLPMLSSDIALSGPQSIANGLTANIQTLTNLPYLRSLATVGLDGATLYDVLAPDNMPVADNTSRTVLGTGTAEVIAHTFQVDCGYIPNVSAESFDWNATTGTWNITLSGQQGLHTHMLLPPMQGIVGSLYSPNYLESSVIFYSTIPVLDANGNTAPQINPPSAPDGAAQSLQLFGCIHTLVPQTGVVDAQTGKLISLDNAGMTRRPSPVWAPLSDTDLLPGQILGDGQLLMTPSGFIEAWSALYLGSPITNYQSGATLTPVPGLYLSYPDFFVLSDLGLAVRGINNTVTEAAQSITLASFEASLAKLLASMFWIVGHVEPSYKLTSLNSNQTFNTATALVKGQTVVQEIFPQARLNSNIVATACGLGASTMLLLISLQYLQFRSDSRDGVRINGTDLLHGIWLYRHHPELATLMGRVENPTDENLRAAGMVSVRLVDRNELNRSMYYAEQRYSVLKTKDDGYWVDVHDASK